MYILDFMGLAVLDPEFSRPMLPWVVREVIYRNGGLNVTFRLAVAFKR